MNPDSTSTTTRHTDEPDDPKGKRKRGKKLDLSLTQVIGGSLAAATAAALGSKLGVAGTIIGAAIVSVISAVAASIYTTSLRNTRKAAQTAVEIVRVRRLAARRPVDVDLAGLPSGPNGKLRRGRFGTSFLGVDGSSRPDPLERDNSTGQSAEDVEIESSVVGVAATGKGRRLRWRAALIGAGAIFLVAIGGITAYELASGQSISGGNRTSLQQVVEGRTTPPSTSPAPSDTQNQQPTTTTTPPRDNSSDSAPPSSGQTSSGPADTTTPAPTTTGGSTPTTTGGSTPTTSVQPAVPTENAKPEAGQSVPASPASPTGPAGGTPAQGGHGASAQGGQ